MKIWYHYCSISNKLRSKIAGSRAYHEIWFSGNMINGINNKISISLSNYLYKHQEIFTTYIVQFPHILFAVCHFILCFLEIREIIYTETYSTITPFVICTYIWTVPWKYIKVYFRQIPLEFFCDILQEVMPCFIPL